MRIIVCGAGLVATGIVRQLVNEDNDVTVVDHSPELIQKIVETMDVNGIVGFASHPSVLEEAGAAHADMIIAVTRVDEVNMIVCQVAHSIFGVPTKIASIRHENYLQPVWKDLYRKDHLPIDVIISPEIEVAKAISHRLHVPGALETIPLAENSIMAISVRCMLDCPIIRIPLYKLKEKMEGIAFSIMGVLRGDEFITPKDDDKLLAEDEVFFVVDQSHVHKAMSFFDYTDRESKRLLVIGGGNIGVFLGEKLEDESDSNVKVIELDKDRARNIADTLLNTTVIHGNALDQGILSEVNISAVETMIAVTNDDEVNILSSLLAKRLGCKRVMTLVNNSDSYTPLVTSLGIDAIVDPRAITVSSILRHIRRGKIRSAHTIFGGRAELIEAEAPEESIVVGKKIKDLDLPPGVKIGLIKRNDEVILPDQDSVVQAHDRIIIVTKPQMIKTIESTFSVKVEFF